MYTEQQYELEKLMMSKQERMLQTRFEKQIEILISYKMQNLLKMYTFQRNVFLGVVSWYLKQIKDIQE